MTESPVDNDQDTPGDSPNVLFLVVDSLRYDAVFGDDAFETPNLDALADDGIVFSNCFSQGISTAPAMTAMLTGRYPLEYGGHWYLEDTQPTFAEEFKNNGYTTGAIHSNPNVSRLRNFHRGFDTFEENILPYDPDGVLEALPDDVLRYLNKFVRILSRTPYLPASTIDAQLADWIAETAEPWFLWTQYMDVHGPYLPGDDFTYRNKFRAEQLWRKAAVNSPHEVTEAEHEELWRNYRLEVEYLDAELGRFLGELDRNGDLENTTVAIVGDHGDEFYEHDDYGHSNLPYDVLTHVPLIIRFPEMAGISQGRTVDESVRCVDILPTALDFAGATLSEEMRRRMVGESLLPLIRDGESPSFDVIVTEKEMRGDDALRFGFRTDRWKFLFDGKEKERYLYDLETDPDETRDVSEDHPDVMERFQQVLDERFEKIERTSENVEIPELDESSGVEERLKALGYK
ncbi:sulfatase family protein [Haloplanus salinarum]|uniref:sulfatase family protein n=1 Tax=Haloplanus salinarum TaxID=1912324 RepID=UPI00214BB174|nr:sulfatase [Haloplanus salinarum]